MKGLTILKKLLDRNDKVGLFAIDKILTMAIPFNAPHGFTIKKIESESVEIHMSNRKLNHNHLGGMHACAMATLGEYCAGLTFIKNFGLDDYRLIMKELKAEYYLQGRTNLIGKAYITEEQVAKLRADLELSEKVLFPHQTEIFNTKGEKVALIQTLWQLKRWDKVNLK